MGAASKTAASQTVNAFKQAENQAEQATKEFDKAKKSIDEASKSAQKFWQDANGRWRDSRGRFAKVGSDGLPVSGDTPSGNNKNNTLQTALDFAAAGYAAKQAWDGAMSAINLSALQQVQETTFQALLNHKEAGSALYDYVSAYAKVSALGREDLANAVTAYSAYTKNADQLERLIKLTERLYAKDPTQGAEGAVFAMRELLSGDAVSIKDRFNMSGFSGETIRNFANTGDIEGMLDYVDQIFNKFGATQEVVDANYDNLITQTNIFSSNLKTAIAESATPAMEKLSGTMKQLNSDMDAGKFAPAINFISNGIRAIGDATAFVGENLNWLLPVAAAATTAFIVYKGVQLATAAATMVLATATNIATGNILGAVAGIAALVGAAATLSLVTGKIEAQTDLDLESAKAQFAAYENEITTGVSVPVEVSNSAPISVKGEVEIEEESLRYMLDIQGQKWLAKFTTATLAPQNVFNGVVIRETVDFEEFTQMTVDSLSTAIEVTAAG